MDDVSSQTRRRIGMVTLIAIVTLLSWTISRHLASHERDQHDLELALDTLAGAIVDHDSQALAAACPTFRAQAASSLVDGYPAFLLITCERLADLAQGRTASHDEHHSVLLALWKGQHRQAAQAARRDFPSPGPRAKVGNYYLRLSSALAERARSAREAPGQPARRPRAP